MKLASYNDGSRDGQLMVVSRDLKTAHYATGVATRLQHLLDDWGFISPQLQDIYDGLNQGRLRHAFPFDPATCTGVLPRAFSWHCQLEALDAEEARGPALLLPADRFPGAQEPRHGEQMQDAFPHAEAVGLAALLGDIAQGASASQGLEGVRLLTTAHLVFAGSDAQDGPEGPSARNHIATMLGPVAITPEELGEDWKGGVLDMPLHVSFRRAARDSLVPAVHRGPSLGALIETLARHRGVAAGGIAGWAVRLPADALSAQAGQGLYASFRDAHGRSPMGGIEPARARAPEQTADDVPAAEPTETE